MLLEDQIRIANESGARVPKVSVCIVTYNQEKYIRQCLQSILDQETNFDFEIIVGDDCSQDGTREIVRELAEKYPDKIRPIFQERNQGPTKNYFAVHNRARGDYVAHLDGDDYALPGKLQVLADHLDENNDCAIVWHRIKILDQHGRTVTGMPITPVIQTYGKSKLYIKDLALYYGLTGVHSGSMYRRDQKIYNATEGEALDYFMTLSFCMSGMCAMYIDQPYGVYRFIASDNTLTRRKGNTFVAQGKISLMKHYAKIRPDLRSEFAAQCLFEILLRTYLKYPMAKDFFSVLVALRTIPNPILLYRVCKVFMNNRHTVLKKRFDENVSV